MNGTLRVLLVFAALHLAVTVALALGVTELAPVFWMLTGAVTVLGSMYVLAANRHNLLRFLGFAFVLIALVAATIGLAGQAHAAPARDPLPPLELPLRLDDGHGVVDRNGNPVGMYRPEICELVVREMNRSLTDQCEG